MKNMILIVLLALIIFAAGCTQPATQAQGQQAGQAATTPSTGGEAQNLVMITSFSFEPSTITVPKGAAVTWTNQDPVAHTITGADFDSGTVGPGQNYSHVFDKAGTYEYHCAIHPSMKGTVVVQ